MQANKIIKVFLADLPQQIHTLKSFIESGDAESAGRQAHSIKGAAANVGGEVLCKLASDLEKTADGRNLSAVKDALPILEAKFNELKNEMEKAA